MKKNLRGFLVLVMLWAAISFKMMWFPICHYSGGCTNACINNLRQIQGAKMQFMIEAGRTNGPVDKAEVMQYLKSEPLCESGGIYTYGVIGEPPVCSVTNALPGVKERIGLFGWRWKVRPSPGSHRQPW